MPHIFEWDGQNVPDELRSMPPGRYLAEPLDRVVPLSPEEEAGLEEALTAMDAEQGVDLDEVKESIRATLKR
jgi:thioredoxin-like negative regulator of GroEL